jgi:hypothetical protein
VTDPSSFFQSLSLFTPVATPYIGEQYGL